MEIIYSRMPLVKDGPAQTLHRAADGISRQ